MTVIDLNEWKKCLPCLQDRLFPTKTRNWGKLICYWYEKKDTDNFIQHVYAATIDLQTGELYQDCSLLKIRAKCLSLALAFPFWSVLKTTYHLTLPFSLSLEIFKVLKEGIKNHHSFKQITKSAGLTLVRNIADIFRTPLYGIILTISCLAGALLGTLVPEKLYDIRALIGYMEKNLNWGQQTGEWVLTPCFQPFANLEIVEQYHSNHSDTFYEENPILHGLNNWARALIRFRRHHRTLFNDCFTLSDPKKAYISK